MRDANGKLFEVHAREKAGMGDDWEVWLWKCMPPGGPTLYYELTGACAPILRSGPRKGRRNWKAKDKATERTFYIPAAEHAAWVARWEATTGKCRTCLGEGKTIYRWSRADGTEYRECGTCKGTGKAETVELTENREVANA